MKEEFIEAIQKRRMVSVKFFSEEDMGVLTRKCAPMDYGSTRKYRDGRDRYHLWDYESDETPHPLLIVPESIESLQVLDETFDPAGFVTWDTVTSPWHISRDWGPFS